MKPMSNRSLLIVLVGSGIELASKLDGERTKLIVVVPVIDILNVAPSLGLPVVVIEVMFWACAVILMILY